MDKKLKIAIIGYGKMGRAIEKLALQRGHEITATIDNPQDWERYAGNLADSDVAVEFTSPEAAPKNIIRCFDLDVPVVTGTTGWLKELPSVIRLCKAGNRTLFHASNFSIGVNFFFELNRKLAEMLSGMEGYSPRIAETHHTQKLDSPSGTAISLANDIISARKDLKVWGDAEHETKEGVLPIRSYRIKNITGTHIVIYDSEIDTIEIKHTAHNRSGFAEGALLAAQWVWNKHGVYTMKDFLNI